MESKDFIKLAKKMKNVFKKKCPMCKNDSERLEQKINKILVCDNCYFDEIGKLIEKSPIYHPKFHKA